jgi:hypothetical protein
MVHALMKTYVVPCVVLLCCMGTTVARSQPVLNSSPSLLTIQLRSSTSSIHNLRAGSQNESRKKVKRSKSKKHSSKNGKAEISKAIKQDASEMMGDAIRYVYTVYQKIILTKSMNCIIAKFNWIHRSKTDELLKDDLSMHPRLNRTPLFSSVSYAIGTSERQKQIEEGGGVEPPANAVIASYFLKSHGGMHGVQSMMSLLAVLFGFGTFWTPSQKWNIKGRLMQRSLLCAMAKHISGLLAVALMSASSIPAVGWKETRANIQTVALDPVAQYLFYCALLVVWSTGVSISNVNSAAVSATTATTTAILSPWWLKANGVQWILMTCILGPILLREIVSTIWVLADVLVLYHSSRSDSSVVLQSGKNVIDALMSIIFTPTEWRNANAETQQKMLAKIVAKASLLLEIGTGLILLCDALFTFFHFSFSSNASKPKLVFVLKQLLCARLYINFMLVRRKKVKDLISSIRGGAVYVPERILNTLLEPSKAMGLSYSLPKKRNGDDSVPQTITEWIAFLLGL